ncbi:ornithine carbamoyltransferase, partial [Oceanidesulfovibrio indonesiensis]
RLPVAWLVDGNNMANSWLESAPLLPIELRLACPEGYEPEPLIVDAARDRGANFRLKRDPMKAVEGAHAVNTDVWVSMGQEDDAARIPSIFEPYQVDDAVMAAAHPDAIVLPCLPAQRGDEVTESVIESPASAVWDQAENRLHAQKALLEYIFS